MAEAKSQLQTLDRALDVLEIVEASPEPVSLTEVARQLGEATPIIFRVLQTLEARGYVRRRAEDKRYIHTGRSTGTGSIRRAVSLLRGLSRFPARGAGLEELAGQAALDPASAREILGPLGESGLVEEDAASHRWRLSYALMEIVRPLLVSDDLLPLIRPMMERLNRETEETVSLFQRAGERQIVTALIPSPHPVRYVLNVGDSLPLYLGAAGKAALAALSDAQIEALLAAVDLKPLTGFQVDLDHLREEVREIRRLGYAVSTGERVEGASAVGATFVDGEGNPRATISLLIPSFRASGQRLRELGERLAGEVRALRIPAPGREF